MKVLSALICGLLLVTVGSAQEKGAAVKAVSHASDTEKLLEAKIKKVWQDYKDKSKQGLGSALAENFREVTDGAEGIFGKETEFSEMEKFTLSHYELTNFHLQPVGEDAALMTYTAHYEGTYEGEAQKMSTVYGEVWTKQAGSWKLLWAQETKLK